jgi:hypothetical protein
VRLYGLYGLSVDCPFPLPAPIVAGGPADITVRWGEERPVPTDPPRGTVLSHVSLGPFNYSITRTEGGYVIRYPTFCDAEVDPALQTIVLNPASSERRPMAELLFTGSILAKILTLRGECVLHASAVSVHGRAVAYIGPPGRGKSTLAALSCASGARLITDDVLRLIPDGEGWFSPTGTAVIRLRPQAQSIAFLLNGARQETLDERIGVTFTLEDSRFPVAALVFPLPSRTAGSLALSRLTQDEALMRLTSFPRVLGWKSPDVLAKSFRWNARLAREIPIYEAVIPWGPPFDPSVASELLSQLAGR